MAQYKVQNNQNIWDIALHLYGSIEGAFDLFISNSWLTMTTDLKAGDILEYHDNLMVNSGIVDAINKDDMVPANGERHVYEKKTDAPLRMLAITPPKLTFAGFSISGEGEMLIDWGDNSELQIVHLSPMLKYIEHYFDSEVDERRMKIYGDFTLMHLDVSKFKGTLYPVTEITVDQFTSISNYGDLKGLKLFNGVVEINLSNSQLDDLSPIYDYGRDHRNTYNGLQVLDLRGVRFMNDNVLDDYLEYLAGSQTHGTRRPCTIYLDTEPSERGKAAIKTILSEPKWNQEDFADSWKFYIKDQLYTI